MVIHGLHESHVELDRFYQNGSPLKYVPDIKYCPHKDLQLLLEAFFGKITKCHTKEKTMSDTAADQLRRATLYLK
jgi:hypothetical protein